MIYVYFVLSGLLIPFLNYFFDFIHLPTAIFTVPLCWLAFVICFLLIQAAVLGISIALVKIDGPQERFSRYYRAIITSSIRIILPIAGVHIHKKGLDKIPKDGRFLLVCNHLHDFDPGVIISALPKQKLAFIAKKEIYTTMPFVSKGLHKLQCLPIDRENNREAVKTIVSAVKLIKEDKASVAVFPEGYCSKNGELQPMRNGVFKIAQKAGVPIVVCAVVHSDRIVKRMFRKPTDVGFSIIDVIPAEKVKESSTAELGDHIYSVMRDEIVSLKTIFD